jgi:hypothetical protein
MASSQQKQAKKRLGHKPGGYHHTSSVPRCGRRVGKLFTVDHDQRQLASPLKRLVEGEAYFRPRNLHSPLVDRAAAYRKKWFSGSLPNAEDLPTCQRRQEQGAQKWEFLVLSAFLRRQDPHRIFFCKTKGSQETIGGRDCSSTISRIPDLNIIKKDIIA